MSDPNDLFTPRPSQPASSASVPEEKPAKARAALLRDKDDALAPPAKPAAPPRASAREEARARAARAPARAVKSSTVWAAFAILLLLIAACAGGAVWFYVERVQPQLGGSSAPAPTVQHVDTAPLEAALGQANVKIGELQKQLDAERAERDKTQGRLQEMADRMALVIQQNSFKPAAEAIHGSDAGIGQMASLMPTVSPSTSELILLKERNRLTGFADKAIAFGDRASLQRIVDVMLDPEMKNLASAAQAEFKRVQAYFEFSASIDPNYKLPVQDLIKDGKAKAEADLTPEQLQRMLLDAKLPWEARLRCAYLLRGVTAPGTDEALLKAIKEDPSLDVAKQAQTSFERRVGRRFRLFDIPSIEAWWQAQGPPRQTAVPMKEPDPEAR